MKDLIHMGSYGAYVWSSVGLTAVVLALNWWTARRRYAALVNKLRRRNATGEA